MVKSFCFSVSDIFGGFSIPQFLYSSFLFAFFFSLLFSFAGGVIRCVCVLWGLGRECKSEGGLKPFGG